MSTNDSNNTFRDLLYAAALAIIIAAFMMAAGTPTEDDNRYRQEHCPDSRRVRC